MSTFEKKSNDICSFKNFACSHEINLIWQNLNIMKVKEMSEF